MKKTKCPLCSKVKGRRDCLLNNGELICSKCCAETRTLELCLECPHYHEAEKHNIEKMKQNDFRDLYSPVDLEIEDQINIALENIENGYLDRAEGQIKDLLELHPESHLPHRAKASLLLQQNDIPAAMPHLQKCIEIFPYCSMGWYNLSYCYKSENNIPKYLMCAKKVIDLGDPEYEHVQLSLTIYNDLKDILPKGMTVELYAKNADLYDVAYANLENEKFEKARDGFFNVLEVDPEHIQSHGNLGLCFAYLGEKERALEYLDKALKLDPEYTVALKNKRIIVELAERGEKLSLPLHGVDFYQDKATSERNRMNS